MAQKVFEALTKEGRIEFRLRADATDYELPTHDEWLQTGKAHKLTRSGDLSAKELVGARLAKTPEMNDFEAAFRVIWTNRPLCVGGTGIWPKSNMACKAGAGTRCTRTLYLAL